MHRRIVVTGVGVVTPLGWDLEQVWARLCRGESGVGPVQDRAQVPSVHAMAVVPRGEEYKQMFSDRGIRYPSSATSDFIDMALLASDLALEHARHPQRHTVAERCGVSVGSGMGSLSGIVASSKQFDESMRKLSPFFIPKVLINLAAGHVSIRHQLKGPNHAVVTACAAGAMSIGDAYNFMRLNYADVMVCGGVECSTDPLTRAGFARMKALSQNQNPQEASRPFDKARDGFVIGEGAGMFVLETLDHALERGAEGQILAEVCGYGVSGDASHITSPPADGDGGKRAMLSALRDAGDLHPNKIGYVNAHATSTPAGDAAEVAAMEAVFGPTAQDRTTSDHLYVSSTKGATGHLLGAAGAVEAAFTVLSLKNGQVPPTLNLNEPDTLPFAFQHVKAKASDVKNLKYAMSNSFGFGGVNASLIFSKYVRP
ncbi:unnamed protein product [Ectocarpus fasciculatus]